jgi:CRP/FNR family transcriptional regulator, cyclic AMP receptor protein
VRATRLQYAARRMGAPLELFRKATLFQGLGDSELASIAALAQRKRFEARDLVVQQTDPSGELFLIVEGHLKVVSAGLDGRDTALGIMGPGELIGEITLLDGGPRSASVVALERCELLVIRREPFLRLLESSPKIAIQLLRVLATRLRRLTERSEDLAFLRVGERLAKRIVGLADEYGAAQPDGSIRVMVKLSQQEIGELVNATRESVNKHIKAWEDDGLLAQEGGHLIMRDLERLRERGGE